MLNVYLTVDVEIWPANWDLRPGRFAEYFSRYITGRTSAGEYGLPFQLSLLKEHQLRAIFFVEPFFSYHFGVEALKDIVGMIQGEGHVVALHAHTEWIGRTRQPIPPGRFQLNLKDYSLKEQIEILRAGKETLLQCGARAVTAFRAGNFGANRDTLVALAANNIKFDSSYNAACRLGPFIDELVPQPVKVGDVVEYPVAVFRDGLGNLRHAQIGASSSQEIITAVQQALRQTWTDFVIFWHSAEFLNRTKTRPDLIAVRRYARLCEFLALGRDVFQTAFFKEPVSLPSAPMGELRSSKLDTLSRIAAQSLRRLWGS